MNEDKMKLEEAIKTYNELKKYKEVIKNIDTNFFFKFAETVLQALENTQKNYELAIKQNITYKQNIYDLKNNAIPKKKIEDVKIKYREKYKKHKAVADKQFEEIGTRTCFDNELAIRDLGTIRACKELLED